MARMALDLLPSNAPLVGAVSASCTISSASARGIAHERTYPATRVTRTSAPSLALALTASGSSRILASSPVLASNASCAMANCLVASEEAK